MAQLQAQVREWGWMRDKHVWLVGTVCAISLPNIFGGHCSLDLYGNMDIFLGEIQVAEITLTSARSLMMHEGRPPAIYMRLS